MTTLDYLDRKLGTATLTYRKADPAEVAAHVKRTSSKGYRCASEDCMACARFESAGPTARWIKPGPNPGEVVCPTCYAVVPLAAWWSHGCGQVAAPSASGYVKPPRARGAPRKVWAGDIPTTCNYCGGSLRNGFADSRILGRSTWGHLCGLCWELYGDHVAGSYWERRGRRFVKVT